MSAFVRLALLFRLLVLAFAAAVLLLGTIALRGESIEALPEFSPPYTEIQTEALGLSAEEVEQLITVPLEADLLNGVEGVETIRSESVPGLSSIVLVFEPGTDIYRARQLVEERLTQAHALPNVSKPPTLLQPTSSSSRVLLIGINSDKLTPIEQSVIARWTVRPRLMGIPGVANVAIWGMRDQQLQVQVDPKRLQEKGVTLSQVIRSAGNAQVVSPLSFLEASTPGTGGFIETPQQRLQVRHLLEKIANPTELAQVPVEDTGGRLRLGDVATIVVDHQPLIGDAIVAGGPGLMLVVEKLPDADTVEVTRGVEGALNTLRPGLAGLQSDTSLFRPANYVQTATRNVGLTLAMGGVLFLAALFLCGFRLRAVLIAGVTIPVAVVTAAVVLDLLGHSLNAISVAGLAAAVLFLVHDTVATTGQAARMLRRQRSDAEPSFLPALTATWVSLRRPAMYAGSVLLLAVVPVTVMAGRPGAFFLPLALAYSLAMVCALAVALTLTPVLAFLLLADGRPVRTRPGRPWRLGRRYVDALDGVTGRRGATAVAVALGGVLTVALLTTLTISIVPTFQDRDLLVHLDAPEGTSNPEMTMTTTALANTLQDVPGVASVGAHVGRAVTGDRVANVSSSDIWVRIAEDADYAQTVSAIRKGVEEAQGVRHEISTHTADVVRGVGALVQGANPAVGSGLDVLTGSSAPLVVRLFGQDPAVLATESARVRDAIAEIEGVVSPRIETTPTQPSIVIEVDLARAQQAGITPGDVRRAEATLLQGIQVGSVFQQQKVFDVVVQGVPQTRKSLDDVRNLLIDKPGGGHVRLVDVADVRLLDAPAVIKRDAVSRRVDITAGVEGRSVPAVAEAVAQRLSTLTLPLEYHAEVLPGSTQDEVGLPRVIGAAALAGLATLLLLQALFRRWRVALLVFAAIPAALLGGILAALLFGRELSLGVLLGLLVVFGFTLRSGLSVVDRFQAVEARPGASRYVRVQGAAVEGLAPVLTSAVAVVAVLLPVVALGVRPGFEVLHPMAVVVLGGLITAVPVLALALPALYLGYAPRASWQWLAEEDDGRQADTYARSYSPWLVPADGPPREGDRHGEGANRSGNGHPATHSERETVS